jgi:signal transduction histidine kinase
LSQILHSFAGQTRWRIAARVLPAAFVTVAVLAVASWLLFANKSLDEFSARLQRDSTDTLHQIRQRAVGAALALDARKDELAGRNALTGDGAWAADLLQFDLLAAAALAPSGVDSSLGGSLLLAKSLRLGENERDIALWLTDYAPLAAAEFELAARRNRQRVLDDNPWHPVLVYPPVQVERRADHGSPVTLSLLPVVVRQDPRQYPQQNRTPAAVYFLDLEKLAGRDAPSAWWCLLDDNGLILCTTSRDLRVGRPLSEYALSLRGSDRPVDGSRVAGLARTAGTLIDRGGGLVGAPAVAVGARDAKMPFTVVVAARHELLRTASTQFALVVMILLLVSLVAPLIGVFQVFCEQERRQTVLVQNLEAIARGDFARRLDPGRLDEVGRVVAGFNVMAESLDEARREAHDKGQRLEAAVDNLRLADKAKDDFLVLISHEVRTPLTSLMGGVEFMRSALDKADPAQQAAVQALHLREIVDIVASSGRRLSGFMNDAIQMTAVQGAERELDLKPVPIERLLEVGLCGVRERARMRNITVVNEFVGDDGWSVLCDLGVLKLALERILSNAVVHNRDGGRVVIRRAEAIPGLTGDQTQPDAEMMHRLWTQKSFRDYEATPIRWLLVEIFNTGAPIPEDRRRALFGKFELVGRIEHHHKGSGLSLPIAQAAIEHHGGRIFMDSADRDGNSFYLLLPCVAEGISASNGSKNLWDQTGESQGCVAGDEKVGQVCDAAGLEVELEHLGAGLPRG